MGAMLLRHKLTRQPCAAVEVDWSHPLARNLRALCVPIGNTFVELVSGRIMTREASAALYTGKGGRYLGSATTGAGFSLTGLSPLLNSVNDSWAFVVGVKNNSTSTTRKRVFKIGDSAAATVVGLDVDTGASATERGLIGTCQLSGGVFPVYQFFGTGVPPGERIVGLTRKTGGGSFLGGAINGIAAPYSAETFWSASTAAMSAKPEQIYISGNGPSSFPLDGGVSILAFFNEFAPQAKLNALTANPWQLLRPMQRRVWAVGESEAGVDELTAEDLVVGSPVLGTPAVGQVHALTATGLTLSSPVLGAPAFGQVHALAAQALVVGSPVLGTTTLTENLDGVDVLFAEDLVVGSPVLGTPVFGQIHNLAAVGLVAGSPVLGAPVLDDGTVQPVTERQTIGTISGGTVYPIEADDEAVLLVIRKFLEVVDAQLG